MNEATITSAIENQISMTKAAQLMGCHVGTVWRHATKGVRGGIKLESWIVGGKRVTTATAVESFLQRLNSDPAREAESRATAEADNSTRRGAEADRTLASLGY